MDERLVRYSIWCDTKKNRVRMDVSGFENSEDAMAFADWLSEMAVDEDEPLILH